MFRNCLLTILLALQISPTVARDDFRTNLENFTSTIKNSGSLDFTENCSQCEVNQSQTGTVYSPLNKKSIELTILSEERARDVFKKLKEDEDIPFNYPYDGCYARAHKMAQNMDDMGIVSGKAFLDGELYPNLKGVEELGWGYHVASLVLVKKGKDLVPTVIDPSIFDRPVSFEEWKSFLTKDPRTKVRSQYFTKRFNYDPESRHYDLREYNEDETDDMKAANRSNARLAEMIEMTKKLNTKGLK